MQEQSSNSYYDTVSRELSRELQEEFQWIAPVDYGGSILNTLVYGSLKSLLERTDSRGYCRTSFGEENGVRCYGRTHYPRDAAEAARALARFGFADAGVQILDFSLRHKPRDQYYLPHVYNHDGTVRANTVQVDTPAHMVTALRACVEAPSERNDVDVYYNPLAEIMNDMWEKHFHSDWSLLNAGNYNEQFDGGNEPICDLFTNAAMVRGYEDLAWMASRLGDAQAAEVFPRKAKILSRGIESYLRDDVSGGYIAFRRIADGEPAAAVHWVNLYAHRWYPGHPEGWEAVYKHLAETTTIHWDGRNVISGDPDRCSILGKFFAFLLAYLKTTRRSDEFRTHVEFLRRTVRRPCSVYPEWWCFQRPAALNEYWRDFWERYGGIWEPYRDNPRGDYTIDSGNCEQTAVFLSTVAEYQLQTDFR